MRNRRIIITRETNIEDVSRLEVHPNVRSVWWLPRGFVLFEFYHPVFELIYSENLAIANAARVNEEVRQQTADAVSVEQRLLAPLYTAIGHSSDALTLMVPARGATYHFVGKGKGHISWPELKSSDGWERARKMRVEMVLVSSIPETSNALEHVIADWSESLRGPAEMKVENVSRINDGMVATVHCSTRIFDAAMALFILLTETRHLTSLCSVCFQAVETSNKR